jgi:hypothetical protein
MVENTSSPPQVSSTPAKPVTTQKFNFDPDAMRARFHEITGIVRKVFAQTDPIRAQINELRRQEGEITLKIQPLAKKLREMEAANDLFNIRQEQAALSRALGGRTGPDPQTMAELEKNPNPTPPAAVEPTKKG